MTMQNPERIVTKQDLRDFYDGIYKYLGGGGSGGSNNVIDAYYNDTDGLFYEEDTFVIEITGEAQIIYQDIPTNRQFRWDGTDFVQTNTLSEEIEKADFDNLPQSEKDNGTVYYIPDAQAVQNVTIMGNRFDKANIYTSDERMIGSYLGKPLYQKTIDFGALPNNTAKSVNHGISDISICVEITGTAVSSTGYLPLPYVNKTALTYQVQLEVNRSAVVITCADDFSVYQNAYVTLQYTKTTDGTVTVGSPEDYSTDEMIVGTWLDGKRLYQRSYELDDFAATNHAWTSTGISASGIDLIVDAKVHTSAGAFNVECVVESNLIKVEATRYDGAVAHINLLTIQYTKTTD